MIGLIGKKVALATSRFYVSYNLAESESVSVVTTFVDNKIIKSKRL